MMLRKLSLQLSLVLVVLATCGFAFGDTIAVPNYTFDEPVLGVGDYSFWTSSASPSAPGVWSTTGESGVVENSNGRWGGMVSGMDGNQMAFWDGPPNGIWLDGITTFEVGKSYTLTIALCERGDYAGNETDGITMSLFGRGAGWWRECRRHD